VKGNFHYYCKYTNDRRQNNRFTSCVCVSLNIVEAISKKSILKNSSPPECIPCEKIVAADVIGRYNAYRKTGADLSIPCMAPLTNMYFQYNGVVAPCCHNTRTIAGIYPYKSIREIWNDMRISSLAKALRNNDFSDGCGLCVPDLLMENFTSTRFGGYDVHGPSAEMPLRMEFNISNRCNLECAMCYGGFSSMIRNNRECLPPVQSPYGEDFFSELSEFIPALHEARFSGGETFLIPEYFRIWDMIAKLNSDCGITVVTNGTIVNHAVKKALSQGKFSVNLSLDSLNPVTLQQMRKHANLAQILKNMAFFREYCKQNNSWFGITVCPTVMNWQDIPELITYAAGEEIPVWFSNVWFPADLALYAAGDDLLSALLLQYNAFSPPEMNETAKGNATRFCALRKMANCWLKNSGDIKSVTIHSSEMMELFVNALNTATVPGISVEHALKKISHAVSMLPPVMSVSSASAETIKRIQGTELLQISGEYPVEGVYEILKNKIIRTV
jgi:MoaA/NifB/PqqE/SkfB family radical SAM enzyme